MDSEELPDWKTMAGGKSKSCSWDSETSPLLRFYDASGDKNQAIKLRHLLQGILDRREEDEIVSVERAEFNKLMKAVADRIKNMIKQGTTTVTVNSIKEEYQQLIDPVEP